MIDSNILDYSCLEPLNVSRETFPDLEKFRQIIISKKVLLGQLESSKEFKAEAKSESKKNVVIEDLKINVRDLDKNDIEKRNLPKNTTGVVVTKIDAGSPLIFVSVNDVIVELQKKKIKNPNHFLSSIKDIINKGGETLYIAIYNASNQRSYITVKLK